MKLYGGDIKEDLKNFTLKHYDRLSELSASSQQLLEEKLNNIKVSLPTKLFSKNITLKLKNMSAEERKNLVLNASKSIGTKIFALALASLITISLTSGPTQDPSNNSIDDSFTSKITEFLGNNNSQLEYALIQPNDDAKLVLEHHPETTSDFQVFLQNFLTKLYGYDPLASRELFDIDDNTCALKLPNDKVLAFVNGFPKEGLLSKENYTVLQYLSEEQINEDYQLVYVSNPNGATLDSLSKPEENTVLEQGTFHLSPGSTNSSSNKIPISYINEDDKFINDCSTDKHSVIVVGDISNLMELLGKNPENKKIVDTSKDKVNRLTGRFLPSLNDETSIVSIPDKSIVYEIANHIDGERTNRDFSIIYWEKTSDDGQELEPVVCYVISDYLNDIQQQQTIQDDGR